MDMGDSNRQCKRTVAGGGWKCTEMATPGQFLCEKHLRVYNEGRARVEQARSGRGESSNEGVVGDEVRVYYRKRRRRTDSENQDQCHDNCLALAIDTNVPLPMDKLSWVEIWKYGQSTSQDKGKTFVALVSTGSFNPPTYMHLRCFELARDAVTAQGFSVIGGYMSPVSDSYKTKGLIDTEHRIAMCNLACSSSDFVMVDPWEARQNTSQRTLTVLCRIQTSLCQSGVFPKGSLKVLLVCGSDLLESFSIPGLWVHEQVTSICRDFGLVCIQRGSQDVEDIISKNDILNKYKNNITIVDEVDPNGTSSTGLRNCIQRGLSAKYLTSDKVVAYIKQNNLYIRH